MSLQHDVYDRPAGARPADQRPHSKREHDAYESAYDVGDAGVEYEPRTEQARPSLVSRIAQVLESDVVWGVIVLGVIITAATFAT